jgi:hypothetical protein
VDTEIEESVQQNFCGVWHAFQGWRTVYFAQKSRLLFWHAFPDKHTATGTKIKELDCTNRTGNSGINFEEFGIDFEEIAWLVFRDKFVFFIAEDDCCKRNSL